MIYLRLEQRSNEVAVRVKKDIRLYGIAVTVLALSVIVGVITLLPENGWQQSTEAKLEAEAERVVEIIDPVVDPRGHEKQARDAELQLRFQQAVAMLHAKQYDYAVKALHRVLELAPRMPEAHVNMGYALIGLKDYKAAVDFFDSAIAIKPMQLNAYYGLALAYEGQGNYPMALSAMESFIHLAGDDHPYLERAQSASWEWGEIVRIERSGEEAPRIIGRDVRTGELIDKSYGEELSESESVVYE